MKTISVTVDDAAWEAVQRSARAQGKRVSDLVSNAVVSLATSGTSTAPSREQRRQVLDKLWERIDTCNVEIGERPTRARTYDGPRFHRH